MPTPAEHQAGSPEIQPMRESPGIHPTQDESLTFSLADFVPEYQLDTAASPTPRQPYLERSHDWEASGSGTQPDYGSQLAASLFHTPPPPPATHTADDPWGTALMMSREAEPMEEITPARVAQEGEVQWNDWHQARVFTRENRGQPADRYTPSQYR